jgi:hypothetical protein
LSKNADPNLRVYTVWFNMLFGDSRDRWDGDGVTDPRVRHFWDEQKLVGNWYSADVLHRQGTTWDFYALYGPDARTATSSGWVLTCADWSSTARWSAEPPRALSQGGSIINRHDQLQTAISALQKTGS